ncbi:MAG: hypothetical protein ABSD88_16580 [Candidatus Korobacteraceae bacterium]|jgi:hypothetical protein
MHLTYREIWTVLHGMGFGAIFLLAFAGGMAGLHSLRPELVTPAGVSERLRRMKAGLWVMAVVSWLTVISGTVVVYPWYRAPRVAGVELAHYPRLLLLSSPLTAGWHNFGMEWKEHIAWFVPILATAVAYLVQRYGRQLVHMPEVRRVTMALLVLAFVTAGIAGALGAFINKAATIR